MNKNKMLLIITFISSFLSVDSTAGIQHRNHGADGTCHIVSSRILYPLVSAIEASKITREK